jgi:predicted DNA binding protein|tara:strand:+ start:797 stop:1012 length:216 start_codon:yes stop_codon:yes gene_type:complete
MTKYVLMNGVRREMTSEEEAKFNKDVEDTKKIKDAKDLEETTKISNRTSGKAKLKAGEALTDAEIEALFGA